MGKDKIRRFAEMETFPNVIQPELKEVLNANHSLKGNWKEKYFKNFSPLILELGCGKGEYAVGLAQEYPEQNFIGLDIKGARMWRGAKEAIERKLNNVSFLRTRIDFINSFFDKDEVDQIWITFPDPQLKESRARKRLTHPMFLNRYKQFLVAGGSVNLKTDSKELYDYTLEVIAEYSLNILVSTDDLYHSNLPVNEFPAALFEIQTFYERKFLQEDKKICYLKFQLDGLAKN